MKENPTVPTRPIGDSTNAAASTAFVQSAVGTSSDLLLPANGYINWGTVVGTSGYGIRDNGGVIEVKYSAGTWTGIAGLDYNNIWQGSNFWPGGRQEFGSTFDLSLFTTYAAYSAVGIATVTSFGLAAGFSSGVSVRECPPGEAAISSVSWAFTDGLTTTAARGGWSVYHENRKYPGSTGNAIVNESEITNLSGVVSSVPNPFAYVPAGATICHQIGSGGECGNIYSPDRNGTDLNPVSASLAINIVANTSDFLCGLNIQATAIVGADGTDTGGAAQAFSFARGHGQYWFTSDQNPKFNLNCLATTAGINAGLYYADAGLTLQANNSSVPAFRASVVSLTANGIGISGAVAGAAPFISAFGTNFSTNKVIDITANNGYTQIYSGSNAPAIQCGGSGDAKNYYLNTQHFFGSIGGGTVYGLFTSGGLSLLSGTAVPAGGTAGAGLTFSSTANLGVFFGSGAPSLSAAKGSLYLRTDGSTTNDRMYVNTTGSTTWTAVITAA